MSSFAPNEAAELVQSNEAPDDVVPNDEKLFEEVIHRMDGDGNDISYVEANEDFLLDFLQSKMNQGLYDLVIKVLKQVDCSTNPKFLNFWDEAHYKKCQKSESTELTAVQKFRIRKRNKPPSGICPEGGRPILRMGDDARAVLRKWFRQHEQHPYPSKREKEQLVERAGISLNQVTTWFANTRRKHNKRKAKSISGSKPARGDENVIIQTHSNNSSLQYESQRISHRQVLSEINVPREIPNGRTANRNIPAPRPNFGTTYNDPPTVMTYIREPFKTLDKNWNNRRISYPLESTIQTADPPLYHPPFMYSTVNLPIDSYCYRPLYNVDQNLLNRYRPSAPSLTTKPESSVISTIRLKLHQKKLQKALEASCQQVSAMESLNSLRRLCDNIEATVVSPVDFAATVQFCECDYCTSIGHVNYTNCCCESPVTTYNPIYPASSFTTVSLIEPQSTQSTRPVYSALCGTKPNSVTRSLQQNHWCSLEHPNYSSSQESQGLVNDCRVQCVAENEEPNPSSVESSRDTSGLMAPIYEDGKQRYTHQTHGPIVEVEDILHLQDSYGTIVGEAVQGLLNLSSQESETSL